MSELKARTARSIANEEEMLEMGSCSHSLKNFQFPVTHWMPLPKAPEDGE